MTQQLLQAALDAIYPNHQFTEDKVYLLKIAQTNFWAYYAQSKDGKVIKYWPAENQSGHIIRLEELPFSALATLITEHGIDVIRFADAEPDARTELIEKIAQARVKKLTKGYVTPFNP